MCGIFGFVIPEAAASDITFNAVEDLTHRLFKLSESRGKESSGLAALGFWRPSVLAFKRDLPAAEVLESPMYKKFWGRLREGASEDSKLPSAMVLIAHSRLVTNGSQSVHENNQPVWWEHDVLVHNGIVCNVDDLWKRLGSQNRRFEVDSEVLIPLIRGAELIGESPSKAARSAINSIEGTASIAYISTATQKLVLATNNGSLYLARSENGILVFASERFILETALSRAQIGFPAATRVVQLQPNTAEEYDTGSKVVARTVEEWGAPPPSSPQRNRSTDWRALERQLEFPISELRALRRCSKCILPETFPFISFDQFGVCNYCQNHVAGPRPNLSRECLQEILDGYRKTARTERPYVLVPFSGGRDSSYGVHFLKKEMGIPLVTFTYDWGMVTDLARRNIARICGALGVENILVSADIAMKRRNICKNVAAWLRDPDLGMIPLFMAGDKHFFTWANRIKQQTGIQCNLWMTNSLENTDFKVGFCGIPPNFQKRRIDALGLGAKLRMPVYYASRFLRNPGYLNSSIGDTLSAYWAYYMEARNDYYLLFDYIHWDEDLINRTLIHDYGWELSPDTSSSWRIGDGTASFYNYAYLIMAGFTEVDTFRSNQIRAGLLTRSDALRMAEEENRPRTLSIKWYTDTIGIPFDAAIDAINRAPRRYRRRKLQLTEEVSP